MYLSMRQVLAGLKTDLQIVLFAIAAGVEGERGVGYICHTLEVVTETATVCIPITANILHASDCLLFIVLHLP